MTAHTVALELQRRAAFRRSRRRWLTFIALALVSSVPVGLAASGAWVPGWSA